MDGLLITATLQVYRQLFNQHRLLVFQLLLSETMLLFLGSNLTQVVLEYQLHHTPSKLSVRTVSLFKLLNAMERIQQSSRTTYAQSQC